jgi:glutamine amidotransferase
MIAIIDSGGANIASVQFALERLGAESVLTRDAAEIAAADRVLLPGVGAAPVAMQALKDAQLIEPIRKLRQPVLGICLGMQLLFGRAFRSEGGRSVPHMGWNRLHPTTTHPLLAGLPDVAHVYFVHSYFVPVNDATIAACQYGEDFTAIAAMDNFMGCQFHPERSGQVGARILQNFLEMPR